MIADVTFSTIITIGSFIAAYSNRDPVAAVGFGLASSIAWGAGSTLHGPAWWTTNLNVFAAACAAAAVGFAAPHA